MKQLPDLNAPRNRAALDAALASRAIADVYQVRLEQITIHGHTDDDPDLHAADITRTARDYMSQGLDYLRAGQLVIGRRKLVQGLAIGIAALDLLDRRLPDAMAERELPLSLDDAA